MKQEYYKQCEFKHENTRITAWIEERGAEVGKMVAFKSDPEKWWEVLSVGSTKITKEQAKNMERRNLAFQRSLR